MAKERFQHKIDTAENWAKAVNFVPLLGEIILYSDLRKIKIGDGQTKIADLQFWEDSPPIEVYEKNNVLFFK